MSDRELLERLRQGDEAAFDTIFRSWYAPLVRAAEGMLRDRGVAEEIVQEEFTRAWRHAGFYDPARASVRTWLYQIARHAVIDARRRASVRPGLAPGEAPGREEPAAPSIEQAMLAWQVASALERLTPEHRQMIRLAHFQGLSVREIARRCDLPEGTVKSRTWYACRALRLALEEMGLP